jgi:hypothetical protein
MAAQNAASTVDMCSIDGCYKPTRFRGYCRAHYRRWKLYGDPTIVKVPASAPAYSTLHDRLRAKLHPSMLPCGHCGGQAQDWAYDHEDLNELTDPATGCRYSADLSHYIPLCTPCHLRFDRGTATSCSIDGCGEQHYGRSYCRRHYQRWYAYGDPLAAQVPQPRPHRAPVCSIEGCEKPHRARGLCKKHYDRWQKYGDPLGGRVPPASVNPA